MSVLVVFIEIENEVNFVFVLPIYNDLKLQLFNKAGLKEMGQELLAWLFEYKIFLLADIIEQGRAKRKIALCRRFSARM